MRIFTVLFVVVTLFRVDVVFNGIPDWKFQNFNGCLKYDDGRHNFDFTIDAETQNETWWTQETPQTVKKLALEKKSVPEKRNFLITFKTDLYRPESFYEFAALGVVSNRKKLNVALVNQPCPVLMCGEVPFNPVRTNTWPHSQLALAASLQDDHNVELLDLRSLPDPNNWREKLGGEYMRPIQYGPLTLTRHLIGDYQSRIAQSSADVYVLTANFTAEANSVAEVIRVIKQNHPMSLVLVGGRDASTSERQAFYFNAGADFVGIGDGDVSLPKFLDAKICGTSDNRLIVGGVDKNFHSELLSFNLYGLDPYRYNESGGGPISENVLQGGFAAYFETSRGCVRECPYCTEAKTKRWIQPMAEVKKNIDHHIQAGCRLFMISDDNLLLRKSTELIEIFNYLREREVAWEFPIGLEMQGLTKTDGTFREELFASLFWNKVSSGHFSGAHRLLLPLEDILLGKSNLSKFNRSQGKITDNIRRILDTGMPFLNIAVMTGGPEETLDDRKRLELNLAEIYNLSQNFSTKINFSIFCMSPLPGTPFGRQMADRVAYSINQEPELWTVATSVIAGDSFSALDNTMYRRELLSQFGMLQKEGKVSPV